MPVVDYMTPNIERFREVLERCKFPEFTFCVHSEESKVYFQIECHSRCNVTGKPLTWKGRKWLMSIHMTDGEIVQTAFKAVLTALEHEAREQFMYRGVSIFDPHYDIEKLVELRQRPDALKERSLILSQGRIFCESCIDQEFCQTHATCAKNPARSQVA